MGSFESLKPILWPTIPLVSDLSLAKIPAKSQCIRKRLDTDNEHGTGYILCISNENPRSIYTTSGTSFFHLIPAASPTSIAMRRTA